MPALPRHPRLPQILEQNWQAEMTGHYTYRTLAQREREPGRKQALENMAVAEKEHAALWAGRLRELGEPEPVYRGKPAGDADSLKNRVGGDDLALRRLEIDESRDIAKYSQQLKALGDAPSVAILERVIEEEQEHYRELSKLIRRYPTSLPRPAEGVGQIFRESSGHSELQLPIGLPPAALLQGFQGHDALGIVPVPPHAAPLDPLRPLRQGRC